MNVSKNIAGTKGDDQRQSATSVLIVGAGPVGLALSLELSLQGVDCVIVDKGDGIVRDSKMGGVSIRTMELCRRWGVSQAVRNCGFPLGYPLNQIFCTGLNGHLLSISRLPSMRDELRPETSPESKQRCPQLWFDPIMARAAEESDRITLRYQYELRGFTQDSDGVTASLADANGREWSMRSSFLVGCDGAGSDIRRMLNIGMSGDAVLNYSVAVYLSCPELLERHDKGPAERYIMVGPEGIWGHLTVVDGREFWRLTVMGNKDRFDMEAFDADHWVKRCIGEAEIPYNIVSVLPWRRSRLVADRFSDNRVFLCGDAAHVMSPSGGHGMNTGVGDSADLGWKLAAVIHGWGGAGLLDSYNAERRPVGLRNANTAAETFGKVMASLNCKHVMDDTERGRAQRQALGSVLGQAAKGNQESMGVALGYRYENSPICWPDDSPATPDDPIEYVPTGRPGHRAPHAWIGVDRSILDLFGLGFVLLMLGADSPDPAPLVEAARKREVPLTVRRIDDSKTQDLYAARCVLVRPDGHVAWRGDTLPNDAEALIDVVCGAGAGLRAPR